MKKTIGIFLLFMVCYHVVHTFFGYGLSVLDPMLISVSKDIFRVLLIAWALCVHYKKVTTFFALWKVPVLLLCVLIIWSVCISLLQGTSLSALIVGFKYDIYPLCILCGAVYIGHMYPHIVQYVQSTLTTSRIIHIFLSILCLGLLWQGLKVVFPDIFMGIGYGPVGDYVLGQQPPIWYRTGPGGWMRLQGLFSGPNNYGFFLVCIFSLCLGLIHHAYVGREKQDMGLRMALGCAFVVSLAWTLSRGAWIGILVQCLLYVWYMYPSYKKYLVWLVGCMVCAFLLIAQQKIGSTSAHMIAWIEGIGAFMSNPWGYGLASAGPSVHWAGLYLPENHYLQILLDVGLPGLVLWLGVLFSIGYKLWSARFSFSKQEQVILMLFGFGVFGLLVEGLFLHVFEDSMVNYLFLVPCGIFVGSLLEGEKEDTLLVS